MGVQLDPYISSTVLATDLQSTGSPTANIMLKC
jgi:hypothetical protein